ncbi:MAG: hypothetical protein AB7Q17_02180 [Phycisphaerae bacterium]
MPRRTVDSVTAARRGRWWDTHPADATPAAARVVLAIAALFGGPAAGAQPAPYEIYDLGDFGGDWIAGVAINNRSEVLVYGHAGDSSYRTGVWRNGFLVDILPSVGFSRGEAINDLGEVVGSYRVDSGPFGGFTHAFVWKPDLTFTDLHPPDEVNNSDAHAIDNFGRVTGTAPRFTPFRTQQAVVWQQGRMDVICAHGHVNAANHEGAIVGGFFSEYGNPPQPQFFLGNLWDGAFHTVNGFLADINDHGTIVGAVGDPSIAARWTREWQNGWVYQHAAIGTLGTTCMAVNNRGEAVGQLDDGTIRRALLWLGAQQIDLQTQISPSAGWTLESAIDINDRGEIVCQGIAPDGALRVCMLRPDDWDGDGLLDIWESELGGIDADGDGNIDLDLHALGARRERKDIFVEIDAMAGRAPSATALDMVRAAFASAPVRNPQGPDGITLHLVLDETGIARVDWPTEWNEFDAFKAARFGTAAERGDPNWANIRAAKMRVFRYCVFANTYDGSASSGLAELPGNDFMVTLGGWYAGGGAPTDREVAGTLMHELGHTLGLKHGGNDHINFKPNFYSVMSYSWQMPAGWQVDAATQQDDWRLDYSRDQLPTLDEGRLSEAAGFGATPASYSNVQALHGCTTQPSTTLLTRLQSMRAGAWADWNGSGRLDAALLAVDLNDVDPNSPASPGEVLHGWCDWNALIYTVGGSPYFADGVHPPSHPEPELSYEQAERIREHAARIRAGDLDCDGVVTNFDIDPFVVALIDPDAYVPAHPDCSIWNADINRDDSIDNFDIDPFVALLVDG